MPDSKINILVADPVNMSGISELKKSKFNVFIKHGLSDDELIVFLRAKNITALIVNSRRKISRNFLSRCALKVIATASRGTDHIDTAYAEKRNIKILNSLSGNSVSAAEHTIALLLALYKNLFLSDANVRNGRFDRRNFRLRNVRGKKIGIVGFGQVGSRVGFLARALGMEVFFNDIDDRVVKKFTGFRYLGISEIFRECDAVSLHIPLNRNNTGFIGAVHFSLLKKNAVFINTSRGAVVNEKEMLEFAKSRPDTGFGLDVYCNEPCIDPAFKSLENAVLTNHTAGKTEESAQFISVEIFKQVNNFIF